jgi:hypothetical protein
MVLQVPFWPARTKPNLKSVKNIPKKFFAGFQRITEQRWR